MVDKHINQVLSVKVFNTINRHYCYCYILKFLKIKKLNNL